MSRTQDERIVALEMRSAEQERTIEELSAELAEQWKAIKRLQRRVDQLTERFLALEERDAGDIPVTKPPHY